jgi:hypothetical protein
LVIDLAFTNEAAELSGQIGPCTISFPESLCSDHAALTFDVFPSDSLAITLPPTPKGYKPKDDRKEDWITTFHATITATFDHSTPQTAKATSDTLLAAIDTASRLTLEPRRAFNPNGAAWWTDQCTAAHTHAQNAPPADRAQAGRHLRHTISTAKREWAHNLLNEARDANDIWTMAKVRKGRQTKTFPPLRGEDGLFVDTPTDKA